MNPKFTWFRRAQTIKCNNFPNHSPQTRPKSHERNRTADRDVGRPGQGTQDIFMELLLDDPTAFSVPHCKPKAAQHVHRHKRGQNHLAVVGLLLEPGATNKKIGPLPNLMDFDGFKLHFPCNTAIGLPFSDPDQLKRVAWHLFYCRGSRWSWRPWFFCQSRACSYWVTNPFSLIFNNPRKPWFSRGFIHTFGTIQWGCWIWTGDGINVSKTIINHPQFHHFLRWCDYHSQSWVVYGIVLTCFNHITWLRATTEICPWKIATLSQTTAAGWWSPGHSASLRTWSCSRCHAVKRDGHTEGRNPAPVDRW